MNKEMFPFSGIENYFVGFDAIVEEASKLIAESKKYAKYPPYNIKKTDENKYVIEMAVAGFGTQDLEIDVEGNTLTVKGSVTEDESEEDTVFKGIASRDFTRCFKMRNSYEVKNAELLNGMLKIYLDAVTPKKNKVVINSKGDE